MGLLVRGYVPLLLGLVTEHLHSPSAIQVHAIAVLEQLCVALADEFEPLLAPLMPKLLSILHTDTSDGRRPTLRALRALETFDMNLQSQLHLVVPAVLRLCEQHDAPPRPRQRAISLFGRLCCRLDLREYASQLVHGMLRVLRGASPAAEARVMGSLCALMAATACEFAVLAPTVRAQLRQLRIAHPLFETIAPPLINICPALRR